MIQCTTCGRPLDKLPTWLAGANVVFVCNNCPNRQAKNIAFLSLESETPKNPSQDAPPADLAEEEEPED